MVLAYGQRLVVSVPSNVSVGENFRLTYTVGTINASDEIQIGKVPDAFEVITGPYVSWQSSYQMAKGILSALVPGFWRNTFTWSSYYIGEFLTKLLFVNALASMSRWIMYTIFGN